jgi:hypothetical protein
MLTVPDTTADATKVADWMELSAIRAANGRIGFSSLVSASELGSDEHPKDISEEEIWQDDLVLSVQDVIAERKKVMGNAYPFEVDAGGQWLQFHGPGSVRAAVYLFCLFISHAFDRSIVPQSLAPVLDNAVRDLFQACSTIAAAGYVDGVAMSFGWPRPEGDDFLVAVKRVYKAFGDGKPVDAPRPGAPAAKDGGIDVIAWRPTVDGLPGTLYLLGQVASGKDWTEKSVVNDARVFHDFWFEQRPATQHTDAMFMPFCLEPKQGDSSATPQEVLYGHAQYLTSKYGVIFYRYRLPRYASIGIDIHTSGIHKIERMDDLPKVVTWVQQYQEKLKAAVA